MNYTNEAERQDAELAASIYAELYAGEESPFETCGVCFSIHADHRCPHND